MEKYSNTFSHYGDNLISPMFVISINVEMYYLEKKVQYVIFKE